MSAPAINKFFWDPTLKPILCQIDQSSLSEGQTTPKLKLPVLQTGAGSGCRCIRRAKHQLVCLRFPRERRHSSQFNRYPPRTPAGSVLLIARAQLVAGGGEGLGGRGAHHHIGAAPASLGQDVACVDPGQINRTGLVPLHVLVEPGNWLGVDLRCIEHLEAGPHAGLNLCRLPARAMIWRVEQKLVTGRLLPLPRTLIPRSRQ